MDVLVAVIIGLLFLLFVLWIFKKGLFDAEV